MTREGLESLTDIRDFTTLLYVILRGESSGSLESSIESDSGMRLATRSCDFYDFPSFKHSL